MINPGGSTCGHRGKGASYKEALRICEQVAVEEHATAREALDGAATLVSKLKQELSQAGKKQRGRGDASDEALGHLRDLEHKLDASATEALKAVRRSLDRKVERLAKFTVTLFGRTLAGKSTIREAITHGDGGTIGKGAQRTTRDIREYEWNKLRIVDTPGIGAYDGEADRDLALSVVDESDLLLFLSSSDGIQESTFKGLKALRSQNKPVVFVLNVKLNLEIPVNLRRFLRNPDKHMGRKAVQGQINRIEKLARDELGMRRTKIVIIHAQAAFLATREKDPAVARKLHAASGIDRLLDALTAEVRHRGPVRRLQTFLDGTTCHLLDLEELLVEQAKLLSRSGRYLRDKFGELDKWLDSYIGSVNQRIEHEANVLFRPLRASISSFVDDNIERSDVGRRWRSRVEALGIDNWMSRTQQQLLDEVQGRLRDFHREIDVEAELTSALKVSGPAQYDPWDVKQTLRRTSAAGAALAGVAGVAIMIGGANFWNPVGLIAGAVSLVALGLSWLFGDREKDLQRGKARAAAQLRDQVDNMERKVANQVKTWFYKNITRNLVRGIRVDTRVLYGGMFSISDSLRGASRKLRSAVELLNRRLVTRTGELIATRLVTGEKILRLVRDPGMRTKLLFDRGEHMETFCRDVGVALGEWVDGVLDGPPSGLVARALVPARITPGMVTINDEKSALVRAPKKEMGRAIGKAGHNVSLASQLLNRRIKIQAERGT